MEMGCGCGMTCWRRLRDWQAAGAWARIHEVLLDRLRGADKIDWSRALVDSSSVRAAYGGEGAGPSPVDRGKAGSKHHAITDANGIPLACSVTGANRHDITELAPLFNKIPPVAGKVGHPRRKPDSLQGDLAYDSEPHRQGLRQLGDRAGATRAWDGRSGWARGAALADRADALVVPSEPAAADPLRAPARYPSGLPYSLLYQNLSQCPLRWVLLCALMCRVGGAVRYSPARNERDRTVSTLTGHDQRARV